MKVKELKIGDSCIFAGTSWSKFKEDENGNAYMLDDYTRDSMSFGNSNIWGLSDVRAECFKIRDNIEQSYGREILVPFDTDMVSVNGSCGYGKTRDFVGLLTFDLWFDNITNIKPVYTKYWLATPIDVTGYELASVRGDSIVRTPYYYQRGFRPFFIMKPSVEI